MSSSAPRFATLLALAWPIVMSRSAQAVVGFADALMCAPLGERSLAAATAGAMNTFTILILPMGMVFIVQSFSSQLSGRGDLHGARRYAWYGLALAGITGLVSVAALPLIRPGLDLFAYEPDVSDLMASYLGIRFLSAAAVVGTEGLASWYGGIGNTRLQMVASIITMVANILLNYLLIEGHWGAPALGVAGAAWASVIASWLGFAYVMGVFLAHEWRHGASWWPGWRGPEFLRMLRFGTPSGFNWFLEFAAFAFFVNVVAVDLGTVPLAALLAVMQVNSVAFMPAFGVASAGAILAGQAIGAGRKDDVAAILLRTLAITATWQVAVGAFYFSLPAPIMKLFASGGVDSSELVAVGATLLALSAAWQLFDAVGITIGESLRAAGDTAWCLWARVSVAWLLFAPGAYIGVNLLGGGPVIAILSVVGYLAVLSIVLVWRFRSGAWRRIDLTGVEPQLIA